MRVGEPTRLTMGSTQVSWVLDEPGQKSILLKFVKKFQPNPARTRGEPSWLAGSNPF